VGIHLFLNTFRKKLSNKKSNEIALERKCKNENEMKSNEKAK